MGGIKLTFGAAGVMLLLTASVFGQEIPSPIPAVHGRTCRSMEAENFASLEDAPTQIVSAKDLPAGSSNPPFCLIAGYVMPNVGFKMGMPAQGNGKFIERGCGGHCGILPEDEEFSGWCDPELRKGYACIVSDMGHRGLPSDEALWASNNLQARVDFGYRATHVVALAGKAIAARYYARSPGKSYFLGCSMGGRQALQEAQRFPWDFDGIVAGAPPIDMAVLYMTNVWNAKVTRDARGKPLLTKDDLNRVHRAALAKCGADHGVNKGVIVDPLRCAFDPGELACSAAHSRDCLTPEQVSAVKNVYSGPANSAGMSLSTGGPLPGSESEGWEWAGGTWNELTNSDESEQERFGRAFYRLFLSSEPPSGWHLEDFDIDRDYKRLSGSLDDSSNTDLRKFKAAGGKLIVYQGLNDPEVPPRATIDYYETVERTMGGRAATQDFFRLYALPGMDHCMFGDGAFAVDWLSALEAWVEQGQAPARLIASHVNVDDLSYGRPADVQRIERRVTEFPLDPATVQFSRPVYPYPTRIRYKGSGDPNDAANFVPER